MLEKTEGEPIARLYINGEPIPQYIEEVFTKDRRKRMIDRCPNTLKRVDGQPVLLYRHVSEEELLRLLGKGEKDGYSGGGNEQLSMKSFRDQFGLGGSGQELLGEIRNSGFSDPESVLEAVEEANIEGFRAACRQLPEKDRIRLVISGLMPATFFGFIPTSLIPFGGVSRYTIELTIPQKSGTFMISLIFERRRRFSTERCRY